MGTKRRTKRAGRVNQLDAPRRPISAYDSGLAWELPMPWRRDKANHAIWQRVMRMLPEGTPEHCFEHAMTVFLLLFEEQRFSAEPEEGYSEVEWNRALLATLKRKEDALKAIAYEARAMSGRVPARPVQGVTPDQPSRSEGIAALVRDNMIQ